MTSDSTLAHDSTPAARDTPVMVKVDSVTKRFQIRSDNSLKERIVTLGRDGRRHRQDFWALDGVSLTINAGQTIGLIGHNGSGKSTLLKIIGGVISPTAGEVMRRGRLAGLLELGAGFHPDLTGRENIYLNGAILGLSTEETEAQFADIVAFSEIGEFIDTQVKFYSSGMYVRLAFSVAVHTDPDLLLVDEVLAVGDEAFQRKCLDKIREFQQEGRTIILVTHSMATVQNFCDSVVLLDHGVVTYQGEPRTAIEKFRDLLEEARQERLPEEEKRLGYTPGRVTGATARGRDKEAYTPIGPGEDVLITTEVEHDEPLAEWGVAIQVTDSRGNNIFSTSSARLGQEFSPLQANRRLQFTLADNHLGSGKYAVTVALVDGSGEQIHLRRQATTFTIQTATNVGGVVYVDTSVEDQGVVS
ncbi:hypothetical protein GCM10022198_10050 [Klugiella xanthotipulae]|uniref:ABC-2 type transport system ATP-binding protein n=1 Tax=Klugiella xanthotipulae TaxID=244735 RepID=A0A543HYI9_9MICO|nr:ABC transporter ATP-binding protein [Klugiella xanthotipulae]TQM63403.1 ABC-2 type transport system ATP-binding protein [Klugiella xanthotipulae]